MTIYLMNSCSTQAEEHQKCENGDDDNAILRRLRVCFTCVVGIALTGMQQL